MQNKDDNVHIARFGAEAQSDRRESVSAVLRRARERHGQDVRSVAQVLRIRPAYLEALESGEFERLPGTAYALGFLRTYAEFLDLDAGAIVDRFKEEAQGAERRTELVFPEPVAEGRIPGGAIILISVVLLALAYGGWLYLTNQGRTVADLIPALPEQLQALIDSDTDAAAPEAPPTAAANAEQPPAKTAAADIAAAPPARSAPPPVLESSASQAPVPSAPRDTVAVPETRQSETRPATTPAPAALGLAPPAPLVSQAEPQPLAVPRPGVEQTARVPQAARPVEPAQPAEATQIAVLPPSEVEPGSATDAYSGPPIDLAPTPLPAPGLAPLNRSDAAETTGTPPLIEATVVIPAPTPAPPPAPPAAPNFTMPGERSPQVYGENNANARIVLRAVQDSWVQVRDSQDALLLTRVLRSGDAYHVPDQPGLTLLTGNAGGIEIEVDGVKLPPLGPIGAVRRQITLDPVLLVSGNQRQ